MERADFAKGMKDLADFYAKTISDPAKEIWWSKLRFLHNSDFYAAIEEITGHERQMPTPGIFLKFADDARARRTTRENLRERDVSRERLDPTSYSAGIAKDCCEGLDMLMRFKSGSKNKYEYLASWAEAMHKKYPKAEFDKLETEARRELLRIERTEVKSKEKIPA